MFLAEIGADPRAMPTGAGVRGRAGLGADPKGLSPGSPGQSRNTEVLGTSPMADMAPNPPQHGDMGGHIQRRARSPQAEPSRLATPLQHQIPLEKGKRVVIFAPSKDGRHTRAATVPAATPRDPHAGRQVCSGSGR